MNSIGSSLDTYSKDEWIAFLKKGAYRGLKINEVARKLKRSTSCQYDHDTHILELVDKKGRTITLNMERLLKKNEQWAFSRLVHNIKMHISSDYASDFNIRITKLANVITKKTTGELSEQLEEFINGDHDFFDIKQFFYQNLKLINASSGDQKIQDHLLQIQDHLLQLSKQAFDLADDAKSRSLAFQIQCTASAMIPPAPGFNLVLEATDDPQKLFLPDDLQKRILSEAYKAEGTVNHPLNLVSKKLNEYALDVSGNEINDEVCLKTAGCKTTKEAIQYIIEHKLISVNLKGFVLKNDDLEELGQNCPWIEKLSISSEFVFNNNNQLIDVVIDGAKLVEAISNFNDLKSLDLSQYVGDIISGDQLVDIAKMHPCLQHLSLHFRLNISGEKIMEAMGIFTDLKSLGLPSILEVDQLIEIVQKHPNLKKLDIRFWRHISVDQMLKIAKWLPKLQKLNFRGCKFTLSDIPKITKLLPNLEKLDFSEWNLFEKEFVEIVKELPNLQSLKVFCFSRHCVNALLKAVKMCPNIQHLDIGSSSISGENVLEVIKELPNLRSLNLSACEQISNDELIEIAKKLPLLEHLSIRNCRFAEDKIDEAVSYLPKLKKLTKNQKHQI